MRPPINEAEAEALAHRRNRESISEIWYTTVDQYLGGALSRRLRQECGQPGGQLSGHMIHDTCHPQIYLLLQALQFDERCTVRRLEKAAFNNTCKLIGLDVIIQRLNLRRSAPEVVAFNRLRGEVAREIQQLRRAIDVLLNPNNGMTTLFAPAHADIISGFIDDVNRCHRGWEQQRADARLAQPPRDEQIRLYHEIEAINQRLAQRRALVDNISQAQTDISILRALARDGILGPRQYARVSDEIRPLVEELAPVQRLDEDQQRRVTEERERLQDWINELRPQVRLIDRRTLGQERGRLLRLLTPPVRERVQQYLSLQNAARLTARQQDLRDQLLRDFDSLLGSLTTHRFTSLSNDDKWQAQDSLLQGLVEGIGVASIEQVLTAVFVGYGPVNTDHDIGLRMMDGVTLPSTLSMTSYPGHGGRHVLTAVDVNTARRFPFLSVAPTVLVMPARFGSDRTGAREELFDYVRSATVPSRTRTTNDLQDVFAKIAYGLLRPPGGRGARNADIDRIMRESTRDLSNGEVNRRVATERRGAQTAVDIISRDDRENPAVAAIPPEVGRHPEVARILAGLSYHNLTATHIAGVSQRGLELLSRDRRTILDEIEGGIRGTLGLAAGTPIFSRDERGAGIRRIILLRGRLREVLSAVYDLIRANADLKRRLWRFLLDLRGAGAQPSRAGQSVTVDHIYRSQQDRRHIVVRIFNAHVSAVSGTHGPRLRCQQLGNIGTTGNAVSYHNHVEIAVYPTAPNTQEPREQDLTGFLLPHEFFPLFPLP